MQLESMTRGCLWVLPPSPSQKPPGLSLLPSLGPEGASWGPSPSAEARGEGEGQAPQPSVWSSHFLTPKP